MSGGGWPRVSTALLAVVRDQYVLDWYGTHGIHHWERVRDNGARLAPLTGADPVVVEFFAALHDSRRLNEARDLHHGPRAAAWIATLDPALLPLSPGQLELLMEACRTHTLGVATDDPTLGTCWDADRLDLLRVGRRPDPRQLITDAARAPEILEWAMARSLAELHG